MRSDEVITLDRLQAGCEVVISDAFARSLEHETVRDASLRATVHQIAGYFSSLTVQEETQRFERTLSWRDRLRALIGRPVVYDVTVTLRRNCPHLDAEPADTHLDFLMWVPR